MKAVLVLLMLVPSLVFGAGQPVTINLSSVSLLAFAQATYKNMLSRDFIISPDALALDRKISVSVRDYDADRLPALVEGILSEQGISSELRDGIYYLRPARVVAPLPLVPVAAPAPVVGETPSTLLGRLSHGTEGAADAFAVARLPDEESEVYLSANRSADFLVQVVLAAFGPRSAVVAASRIVITGSPERLKKIRAVLDAVDQLPRTVDVSASWIEVTHNDLGQQGISVAASVLGAKLGGSLGWIGSNAVSLKGANFSLVIDALKTDGRFKQVSNSRILGDEYEKVLLSVGDETPTISSSGKDNSGNAVQNIVYRPSGVILEVLPKVLGGGKVSLVIDGQISSFKATVTGVTGSPTLIKRQVKTSVTVGDGEVLLIGGLNDKQDDDRSAGLSFLPSSWALKTRSQASTDLVLILSAKVTNPG